MSNATQAPKYLNLAFARVTAELLDLFLKKHRDYGKGNILAVKELGIAMRLTEKVERLKNLLMNSQAPANESIEETWADIAVYAVIAIMFRRGWFQDLEVEK